MERTIGNKIGIGVLGLFTVVFMGYVAVQYFIIGPNTHTGFVGTKASQHGFQYYPWIYVLYTHIIFGSLALILGPFQFSNRLRQKNKQLHRNIGKGYVLSVLMAFIAGLYLAFFGTGGITGVIGFYSLEAVWLLTTLTGFLKIRKKEITAHKEWMTRSYAVTLTFVSFRIFSIFAIMIEGKPGVLFGLTVIFSWAVNLLIAEQVISRARKRKFSPMNPVKAIHK